MGWNFCKKALKKLSICSVHTCLTRLSQIAHSTVLRMQICFAWKSIWSCSKESRTALLLSAPVPSRAPPLAVYVLSRGKHFTSSTRARDTYTVSGTASKHHGPICRSRRPTDCRPCPQAGQAGPQLFVHWNYTCNAQEGNYPLTEQLS